MRLQVTLEASPDSECGDTTIEMDEARTRLELRQGDELIWLDEAQRDELVSALEMLAFPGEDVELEDDDD